MDEAGDAVAQRMTQPRNSNIAVFAGANLAFDGPQLSSHTDLSYSHTGGQPHDESHIEFDDDVCIGIEVSELVSWQTAMLLAHYELDVAEIADDRRSSSNHHDDDSVRDTDDEYDEDEFAYATVQVGRPLSACSSESTNAMHSTSTSLLTSRCATASD